MKKGLLIILSGPSGVGKGTVRDCFMKDPDLNLSFSVSMTSRAPRAGETDGVEYFFVSKERFEQAIENDELLEYAQFVGNYYGTPLKAVEDLRNQGKNVLLEIEVQGASKVMAKCPDALSIFIIPPSLQELENRIRGRKTETEEAIQGRLAKAAAELPLASNYQYVVPNVTVEEAAANIRTIILNHMK